MVHREGTDFVLISFLSPWSPGLLCSSVTYLPWEKILYIPWNWNELALSTWCLSCYISCNIIIIVMKGSRGIGWSCHHSKRTNLELLDSHLVYRHFKPSVYSVYFCLQSVSIGAWGEEPEMGGTQSAAALPTSPTSGSSLSQPETPELLIEYWTPKGQSQKVLYDFLKIYGY